MENFFEKYFTKESSFEKWSYNPIRYATEMVKDEVTTEALHELNQKLMNELMDGLFMYLIQNTKIHLKQMLLIF